VGGECEYHLIVPSRGYEVIESFMGECEADVWVCDCWKAQLNAPARLYQICLAHQIRNLQGLIDRRPQLRWAREMQALFRKAIRLGNRRQQMTERGYQRQVLILHKHLERLLQRRFRGLGTNLLERYRKYRDSLFVFLQRSDVPADNNACERALRPSVIHRKVMGSFRSEWGPQAYAALTTVLNTAKRHGESAFQKLVSLMGTPVLPFLDQPVFA
jgi:transposase